MRTKDLYLILDTETATLPFVNEIAKDEKQKKKIAIAKPLVYDIGWTIADRQGNILQRKNYLIQETFFVPNIFNTAYYKDKRPFYIDLYQKGEIDCVTWDYAMRLLLQDMEKVKAVCAYNAVFDFKKAIPFTERYIKNLYSDRYNEWEQNQKQLCKDIVNSTSDSHNDTYLEPIFILREVEKPILDLWGLATEKLLNNQRYKDFCLENGLLTNSGLYFKTSAETTFQYLTKNKDFVENHTALSDAEIETEILAKILAKGKADATIGCFPFRELGETHKYVEKKGKAKYKECVIMAIEQYLKNDCQSTQYEKRLENILENLYNL